MIRFSEIYHKKGLLKLRRIYIEQEALRLIRKLTEPRHFLLRKGLTIYFIIGLDKFILRKIEDLFTREKHWIKYVPGTLMVEGQEMVKSYPLEEIRSLEIHYQKLKYEGGNWANDFFLSTISFTHQGVAEKLFFHCSKNAYLKICQALYHEGIIFKEYRNRRRVYLGRKPNYEEIQQLKAKYGFEW